MFAWQSAFVPHDRVLITGGPMQGFAGTVVNAPEPGHITLAIDGFHEQNRYTLADTDVELCKPGEPESTGVD
jgi:hypothetical protein